MPESKELWYALGAKISASNANVSTHKNLTGGLCVFVQISTMNTQSLEVGMGTTKNFFSRLKSAKTIASRRISRLNPLKKNQ